MDNRLTELIAQGYKFNFANNSVDKGHGVYSNPSPEFLAWISSIQHYLIRNYDDNSGPVILFRTVEQRKFKGFHQDSFDEQLNILRGVLSSCKENPPSKIKQHDDNEILSLLKNKIFWGTIVVLTGGAFALGLHFGNNKFDNNLIELTETNKQLLDSINAKDQVIKIIRHNSDSALNILGHMPYNEMTLDTLEFRKVQTNIENAGAALYLNK